MRNPHRGDSRWAALAGHRAGRRQQAADRL